MRASLFRRSLVMWLPVAGATTVLAMTIYVGVQQAQRSDADDPQLQLARDAALAISAGAPADQVVGGGRVDVASSLSPWGSRSIAVTEASSPPRARSMASRP